MLREGLSTVLARPIALRDSRVFLIAIGILFLGSRLALLNFNQAEFTDGYLILQWSFQDPIRWHPLYPLLIKPFALFLDPILAGRLVSILASFFTLIPLHDLVRTLYSKRAALLACLLFAVSPLNFWAGTHVLTEPLFVLFCVSALDQFVRERFLPFSFFSMLAFLTRPDGYLLLPLWLYASWKLLQQKEVKTLVLSFIAFTPAVLYLYWMSSAAPSAMYEHTFAGSFHETTLADLTTRFMSYVEILPYIVFYPVFVLAILQLFRRDKISEERRRWRIALLYFNVVILVGLSFHNGWSTRFLILPATLLLPEAAAMMIRISRKSKATVFVVLASLIFAGNLFFALAGIYGQKEMFNDVKEMALAIQQYHTRGRIFTDEYTKTAFYTDHALLNYDPKTAFKAGDVIILHSFYSDLDYQKRLLENKYRVRILNFGKSEILPILASLPLSKGPLSNNITASLERFHPQRFYSVIFEIK